MGVDENLGSEVELAGSSYAPNSVLDAGASLSGGRKTVFAGFVASAATHRAIVRLLIPTTAQVMPV